jgi:hypothetical protein
MYRSRLLAAHIPRPALSSVASSHIISAISVYASPVLRSYLSCLDVCDESDVFRRTRDPCLKLSDRVACDCTTPSELSLRDVSRKLGDAREIVRANLRTKTDSGDGLGIFPWAGREGSFRVSSPSPSLARNDHSPRSLPSPLSLSFPNLELVLSSLSLSPLQLSVGSGILTPSFSDPPHPTSPSSSRLPCPLSPCLTTVPTTTRTGATPPSRCIPLAGFPGTGGTERSRRYVLAAESSSPHDQEGPQLTGVRGTTMSR